jgi:ClpA/ClpB-like protein
VRFTDEMFARLDQASSRTGLPVNSIVIAACLEWMERHIPGAAEKAPRVEVSFARESMTPGMVAPRWSTLSRAVKLALARREQVGMYPFDRFSDHAKELLTLAQAEAEKWGHSYIGTEHLLLATFGNPDFHSARVLAALGVERDAVSAAIEKALGGRAIPSRSRLVPTSRTKKVIELAFERCGSTADARVGTHHVLWALAAEGNGIGAHVLADLGVKEDNIALEIAKLADPER